MSEATTAPNGASKKTEVERGKGYAPELKQKILAELAAGEAVAAVGKRHGITSATLYTWRQKAHAEAQAALKKRARAAKKHGANGHAASNGKATTAAASPETGTETVTLELVGLRSLVRSEVRKALQESFLATLK